LTLSDGSPPKIQLISDRLINDVGEAWSVAQTSVDGANSLAMAVYPVSEDAVIGTGNHGMIQIYNTSSQTAHWKLQDLKVTRTLTKPSEVFACSGVMQGRNIASAAGDYVKQTINIIQGKSDVVDIKVSYLIDADGNSEPITVPPFT